MPLLPSLPLLINMPHTHCAAAPATSNMTSTVSGNTFILNTAPVQQAEAQEACNAAGGHLASYSSQEEQQEVEANFVGRVSSRASEEHHHHGLACCCAAADQKLVFYLPNLRVQCVCFHGVSACGQWLLCSLAPVACPAAPTLHCRQPSHSSAAVQPAAGRASAHLPLLLLAGPHIQRHRLALLHLAGPLHGTADWRRQRVQVRRCPMPEPHHCCHE
jgi:hypothetical protein